LEGRAFQDKEHGLKGIKFHPDYQKFFVDDKKMFQFMNSFWTGLIVVFHAGVDIGLPAPYHATPERLEKIVRTFPRCKVVAAHMEVFLMDDVERFCRDRHIFGYFIQSGLYGR